MPIYHFHIFENGHRLGGSDDVELIDDEAVRKEAMRALPEIARDQIVQDGDRQAFTVMVTDESGEPIYTATINFAGLWLRQALTSMS